MLVKEGLLDLRIFLVNRLITTTELIRSIFFLIVSIIEPILRTQECWLRPIWSIICGFVPMMRYDMSDSKDLELCRLEGKLSVSKNLRPTSFHRWVMQCCQKSGVAQWNRKFRRNSWMLISFGICIINNLADFFGTIGSILIINPYNNWFSSNIHQIRSITKWHYMPGTIYFTYRNPMLLVTTCFGILGWFVDY